MTQPSDLPPRLKRLFYRANHRGMRELDMLIGQFADARVPTRDRALLVVSGVADRSLDRGEMAGVAVQ